MTSEVGKAGQSTDLEALAKSELQNTTRFLFCDDEAVLCSSYEVTIPKQAEK